MHHRPQPLAQFPRATSYRLSNAREKCALELNPQAKAISEIVGDARAGDNNSSLLRSSRLSQTKRSGLAARPVRRWELNPLIISPATVEMSGFAGQAR
ncbi:hypothetical protein X756_14345 [Mesorhizobium sp. LSHC412B00]|nr:hypothetical protein X756_14345 [Mesorhizobium sp. LSHC412B00]